MYQHANKLVLTSYFAFILSFLSIDLFSGDTHSAMVTAVGNRHDDPSSNPRRD